VKSWDRSLSISTVLFWDPVDMNKEFCSDKCKAGKAGLRQKSDEKLCPYHSSRANSPKSYYHCLPNRLSLNFRLVGNSNKLAN